MEIKGWSATNVTLVLGMSLPYVQRLLSLVDAPKEVKKLVEDKGIPQSIAGE